MPKPTYDPDGLHWVAQLGQIELDDEAFLAEAILGIHGTTYTGKDADLLAMAVAQQVSFQVKHGVGARVYIIEKRGQRRYEFSGAANRGRDPVAAGIVEGVTGVSQTIVAEVSNNIVVMTHAEQG